MSRALRLFSLCWFILISAVAAEDKNERDDDDPDTVIVKKVAKTVIHTKSS